LLIRGLEEDPTDAEDSALLAHAYFPFLAVCYIDKRLLAQFFSSLVPLQSRKYEKIPE